MQSFEGPKGTQFDFNSDLSGDVHINHPGIEFGEQGARIPGEDLLALLANIVRNELISKIEGLSAEALLWGKASSALPALSTARHAAASPTAGALPYEGEMVQEERIAEVDLVRADGAVLWRGLRVIQPGQRMDFQEMARWVKKEVGTVITCDYQMLVRWAGW